MTNIILHTKLNTPRLQPDLVLRPNLVERLAQGASRKLTLISAPAGFGKTTIASMWVAQASLPAAWLSLGPEDNDLARFLAYLIAAFQRLNGQAGTHALALLQSPQPPAYEPVLTSLLNDLAAADSPVMLILDDYHLITTPAIHEALTFLLDHVPPHICVMILTRADPPLPIPRWRGRGELAELRATDLRFSLPETTAFLARLPLSTPDIEALQTRTEGWIAGLQMAALSMQRRQDLHAFVASFTGSQTYIADYLTDEVLEQQPAATKNFLLHTAILDQMTGPLCDALLERTDSQSVLEAMQAGNLFLVALDDEQRWYRYHHLFAALLVRRLQRTAPALIPRLHQRAGAWFEQQGLLAEAIKHRLAAQEFDHAASLIDRQFDQLWETGEHTTLKRWLDHLPEATLRAWPQLKVRQAIFHVLAGQVDRARNCLDAAEQALHAGPLPGGGSKAKWLGIAASLRGHLAWVKGAIPEIMRYAEQALSSLPEQEAEWRSFAAMTLGAALNLEGRTQQASDAYEQALDIARKSGNLRFMLGPGLRLAFNLRSQGQLHRTMALCEENIQRIESSGHQHPSYLGAFYSLAGDILCEWNRLEEALDLTQQGLSLGKQGLEIEALTWNYYLLIRVLIARQDLDAAAQALQELDNLYHQHDAPGGLSDRIAEVRLQLLLAQHDLPGAEQVLKTQAAHATAAAAPARLGAAIQQARFLLAKGQQQRDDLALREALALLCDLAQVAAATRSADRQIKALAVQALVHQALGDPARASETLQAALNLGEAEGYVHTFVGEGAPMQALLQQGRAQTAHWSRVRSAFAAGQAAPPQTGTSSPETLTAREQQVLRYLKTHLTTTEIADELFLSVHTVRSHVKSIYSKLQVSTRTGAVERATELGLI